MGIQPIRKTVLPEIPDKLYFRIGDVARLCEVPAYVLRFWETEFPQLKPNKGGTGQRLYRKRDVEMALRIKSLLYDQGYTIPGARQVFKTEREAREAVAEPFAGFGESVAAPAEPLASLPAVAVPSPVPAAERFVRPEAAAEAPDLRARLLPAAGLATPSDYDAGAEVRRQVKLHAIRAELQALLEALQTPSRAAASLAATAPKVQPLRPRLVLEPRPAAPRPEPVRGESLRLVTPAPRDQNQDRAASVQRDPALPSE